MSVVNLPESVRKTVNRFVDELKDVYGDNLVSIILYGSAASGEYSEKNSNINMAVILSDTSMAAIAKASRLLNKRKFSLINPVFLTEDYIRRSTDVFPIEFIDMKESHVMLYGRDILEGIDIGIRNLRFQCEQELKSKIMNIKRAYLKTTSPFLLRKLLFKSAISCVHLLRNLLRLKGKTPPYVKEEALAEIGREFNVDVASLEKILTARNKNSELSRQEITNLLASLIETVEVISSKVDQL